MEYASNMNNWYWAVAGDDTQVYSSASKSFVELNDAAYETWLANGGNPTKISADDMIKLRIETLENTITTRRMREAALGIDSGWMVNLNSEIAALRGEL